MTVKHNQYYYPWNNVELRDADGTISTGCLCNLCHNIVPSFYVAEHIKWHERIGDDTELSNGDT